jgi:single-strand DNA-binding protein
VGTTRSWTNANGARHEETEWFNVVAWDQLAEACKDQLHKDAQVYVEGRLQTRGWEDQDKRRHFRTELVAQKMIKLGGPAPALSSENCFPEERQNAEGEASF